MFICICEWNMSVSVSFRKTQFQIGNGKVIESLNYWIDVFTTFITIYIFYSRIVAKQGDIIKHLGIGWIFDVVSGV